MNESRFFWMKCRSWRLDPVTMCLDTIIYLIFPWRGAQATKNKNIRLQVKFKWGPVKLINKCLVNLWVPVVEGKVLILRIR
jgi:hypothetical protein